MGRTPLNRELTSQERAWLRSGLASLATGEYFGGGSWINTETGAAKPLDEPVDPSYWLEQIDTLRVVGQCDCGEPNCHTVQFQDFETGSVRGLVSYHTEDGRILNILINERTGRIAEPEVI
jgi:hypothetical protein